jgi:hypothetical protein
MRTTVCLPLLAALAACAAAEPSPKDPSSAENPSGSGATSRQAADDPARSLTQSECASLGEWLVDACNNRPNSRSAQVDGWCSDLVRTVGDGSWVTGDCVQHIKYVDSVCFRSTTIIRSLMDCDYSVSRP